MNQKTNIGKRGSTEAESWLFANSNNTNIWKDWSRNTEGTNNIGNEKDLIRDLTRI